ncbi:molybdenum ABC transporter ATP-binding protein [Paracoccus tibetensis]|uniref:Molybdate transport system ATP-binding protein n=1 Tax=Paracoccus tibetensis TaxID=336292 RepID=A0A1G5FP64_9RHOB|nr:ATP-binding cassette domain-containing protein [Paracoccus tibetensis]SCY40590.1 molybdate transport system ATP-binding protein [Paracoccus tibetensis]
MALDVDLRAQAPIPLDLGFRVAPGEIMALVGPSGSGKTTILRAIAGLWRPEAGRVAVGAEVWLDSARRRWLPPHRRRTGLVFQNYALFPHMTALGNVMAAMDDPTPDGAARILGLVNLGGMDARRPAELSGGQQQRVALARALARRPLALLLDEPFSAVDRATRVRLHEEVLALRAHLSMPVLLVTHDLSEAERLADRIAVIEQGRIVAEGAAHAILSDAAALRVLGLEDAISILPALVAAHLPGGLTRLEGPTGPLLVPALALPAGARVQLRVRSADVLLSRSPVTGLSSPTVLAARIEALTPGQGALLVRLRAGASVISCRLPLSGAQVLGLSPGEAVHAVLTDPVVTELPG